MCIPKATFFLSSLLKTYFFLPPSPLVAAAAAAAQSMTSHKNLGFAFTTRCQQPLKSLKVQSQSQSLRDFGRQREKRKNKVG
jgi:hypothetical protein